MKGHITQMGDQDLSYQDHWLHCYVRQNEETEKVALGFKYGIHKSWTVTEFEDGADAVNEFWKKVLNRYNLVDLCNGQKYLSFTD